MWIRDSVRRLDLGLADGGHLGHHVRDALDLEHGRERDADNNGVPLRPASVEGLRNLARTTGQETELDALLA